MKTYCLLLALLCTVATNTFGQPVNDSITNQKSYNFYRAKAKKQSTTALILFFGGITLATVSFTQVKFWGDTPPQVVAGVLTGVGMELGGLAFAAASSNNRRKARRFKTAISMQSSSLLNGTAIQKIYYPSLSLKVHL